MNVRELIAKLQEIAEEDGEAEVILSSDGEGNKHSPLPDNFYMIGWYRPNTKYNGEMYSDEDIKDEDNEINTKKLVRAICFYPTN